MAMARAGAAALVLAMAACAHSEPFEPGDPDTAGPVDHALPARLTFNVGDDRSPSGTGDEVIYSRYDPARGTSAHCIAALPAAGGPLRATWCPPPPSPADTFVGTWLEPALSPDGRELAFVWQRGAAVSALGAWSHHLVVASVDSPGVPRVVTMLAGFMPDGRRYNTAAKLSWVGGRVLFLAALDSIEKVKGGGAARFTDTAVVPRALFAMDPATGTPTPVPGGDSAVAYAPAPSGELWIARAGGTIGLLDADGTFTPVTSVAGAVTDLVVVDGRLVVADGMPLVEWIDPATGARGTRAARGPVRRLAATTGRRFVAEVEADERAFGAPANLWLFELPATATPAAARAAGAGAERD
jgi:hypothetical protein